MSVPTQVLGRAFRLIFAQPFRTLRVIFPGLATCIIGVVLAAGGIFLTQNAETEANWFGWGSLALAVLGFALMLRGFVLFAVMWHRHALVPDHARDQVMRPAKGTLNRYLGRFAVLFLPLAVIGFPLGFIGGAGIGIADAAIGEGSWLATGINALTTIAISWIGLRVSLILPGVSIAYRMRIADSWAATRPISKDIFWTAALLGIFNAVALATAGAVVSATPIPGVVFLCCVWVFQSLLYVSVLSTLYGYLIEGRALD